MTIIRFSAGHGNGKAFNRGGVLFNEGDENLVFTDLLMKKLNSYVVDVKEIRRVNGDISTKYGDLETLSMRSRFGNGADLFYSAHSNAHTPNSNVGGVEIILSYQSLKYYDFAVELCKTISDTLGINNRGVKFRNRNTGNFETKAQAKSFTPNDYGELYNNGAKCSMIVEHFFHTNRKESQQYLNNRDRLAENIVKVIVKHFGLKLKSQATTTTTPKTETVPTTEFKSGQKYVLNNTVKGYSNASSARTRTNPRSEYKAGTYTIYRVFNGMLNITTKPGIPGAWVNPGDNVAVVRKSVTEIAREVIDGKWGNGQNRKYLLQRDGYNYDEVQREVNRLLS